MRVYLEECIDNSIDRARTCCYENLWVVNSLQHPTEGLQLHCKEDLKNCTNSSLADSRNIQLYVIHNSMCNSQSYHAWGLWLTQYTVAQIHFT